MKRIFCLILVFVSLFAFVSCSSKKKKEETLKIEEEISQEISAEKGGKIENSDKSVSIEVPGEALESDTKITMKIYDAGKYIGTEGKDFISKVVEFEPSGIIFKKPVIITMKSLKDVENKIITAAVYRDEKGEWSYSKRGAYVILTGRDEGGDPIMKSAGGDPIMLNAGGDPIMIPEDGGDPIMLSAGGDPIMVKAGGDPIMQDEGGDPIMQDEGGDPIMHDDGGDPIMNAAGGDPIMHAAGGDPIMMTTGHFTAYGFIALDPTGEEAVENPDKDDETTDKDDDNTEITENDDVINDEDEISDNDDDNIEITEDDDAINDEDETPDEIEDLDPINPCDGNPCQEIANSTHECLIQDDGYACGCLENYTWNSLECLANSQNVPCTDLPENAEWNSVSTITQTWSGSAWLPSSTAVYSEEASTENCRFKCAEGFEWNDYECVRTTPLSLGNICTGQNKCYDNEGEIECPAAGEDFYGQDAQYAALGICVPQSFAVHTVAGDNIVIDRNTKLIWQQSPSEETFTWDDAITYCENLTYAGKSDWRVPNPLELLTIVDNSKNPATNSNFTNMPTDSSVRFWTSKEYKGNTSYAYAFEPYYGFYSADDFSSNIFSKTKTYQVLCVGGDEMQPATSSNFTTETISGSVVVTDSATGLMWQKDYASDKTWQQALEYCEDLTYAGYSDWRLPNKNELVSLVNYEKSEAPYSDFPDMPTSIFMSSSTYYVLNNKNNAWGVNLLYGSVHYIQKTMAANYHRCVRSE